MTIAVRTPPIAKERQQSETPKNNSPGGLIIEFDRSVGDQNSDSISSLHRDSPGDEHSETLPSSEIFAAESSGTRELTPEQSVPPLCTIGGPRYRSQIRIQNGQQFRCIWLTSGQVHASLPLYLGLVSHNFADSPCVV